MIMFMGGFSSNLSFGNRLEVLVWDTLKSMCPDCDVMITEQTWGSDDRVTYKTCDVVVVDEGRIVFGIECKVGDAVYRKCYEHNGWSPDDNIILNKHSIDRYLTSDFPFYILNLNIFSRKVFWIDVNRLPDVRHSTGYRKSNYCNSDDEVINYDGGEWNSYKGVGLEVVLGDIRKSVGI